MFKTHVAVYGDASAASVHDELVTSIRNVLSSAIIFLDLFLLQFTALPVDLRYNQAFNKHMKRWPDSCWHSDKVFHLLCQRKIFF